jgi:hypothetical protein
MKTFTNYLILPDNRLILECCKGKAQVEDAIRMKSEEMADPMFNKDYNIIVDFREFETTIERKVYDSISEFFNFLKNTELKSKIAFLTTEPNQVVISLMLKGMSNESFSLEIKVFSTVEAAIRFVGLTIDKMDLINEKLEELNKCTSKSEL